MWTHVATNLATDTEHLLFICLSSCILLQSSSSIRLCHCFLPTSCLYLFSGFLGYFMRFKIAISSHLLFSPGSPSAISNDLHTCMTWWWWWFLTLYIVSFYLTWWVWSLWTVSFQSWVWELIDYYYSMWSSDSILTDLPFECLSAILIDTRCRCGFFTHTILDRRVTNWFAWSIGIYGCVCWRRKNVDVNVSVCHALFICSNG